MSDRTPHHPDPQLQAQALHQDNVLMNEHLPNLSSIFMDIPELCGTRTQTIILIDYDDNVYFKEWTLVIKTEEGSNEEREASKIENEASHKICEASKEESEASNEASEALSFYESSFKENCDVGLAESSEKVSCVDSSEAVTNGKTSSLGFSDTDNEKSRADPLRPNVVKSTNQTVFRPETNALWDEPRVFEFKLKM